MAKKNESIRPITDLLDLETKKVTPEELLLDPNNPRLFAKEEVPELRIEEEGIQDRVMHDIKEKVGIDDLVASIESYGFLIIDRVVVKPIEKGYIVIEGNRRIAALKTVKENHTRGMITLDETIRRTLDEIEVLIYKGAKKDIAWRLQGLRHISGIKEWTRFLQAKFVTEKFFIERGMGFREITRLFNIKNVGKLIRSYFGYMQSKEDDEYGEDIKPDKFSMFEGAVFTKESLKQWLGWSDAERKFKNIENFRKFLYWITAKEDEEPKVERALDARDILSKLVMEENKEILEKFENGTISLSEAKSEIDKKKTEEIISVEAIDVNASFKKMEHFYRQLSTLPLPLIREDELAKEKFLKIFEKMQNVLNKCLEILHS